MMLISSIMLMMVTVVLETTTPAMVFTVAARCSPEHIQNLPQTSRFCPFENCPPNKVLPGSHACDAQASSITLRLDRLRLNRRRLSFRAMRHSA